ncbi:hypothetical protein [Enhydrobacter aerosaccus]|uniref:hypothetical protein n=1 Tax=Enhydrobacter aerosaccus TaxID=225324 RepID=UPI000A2F70BD|nr:hypothetical protein [Enhydrobacter aerosaccus]
MPLHSTPPMIDHRQTGLFIAADEDQSADAEGWGIGSRQREDDKRKSSVATIKARLLLVAMFIAGASLR